MSVKVKIKQSNNINSTIMPCITTRGLVVFPGNIVHFEVSRKQSINAIEESIENSGDIFLIAQKYIETENPTKEELYNFGVVSKIKQVLRVSETLIKVIVEGKYRAISEIYEWDQDFIRVNTKKADTVVVAEDEQAEVEATMRLIRTTFDKYLLSEANIPQDVISKIMLSTSAEQLSEYLPANLPFKFSDKQIVLEESVILKRLSIILDILQQEIKVLLVEGEIRDKLSYRMEKSQRDYYLREKMRTISDELDDGEDTRKEADLYRDKILELNLDEEANEKLLKETERLSKMPSGSQETAVIRTYLDTCINLPWGKFSDEKINIKAAKTILEKQHYGLVKVKERILEVLAVQKLTNNMPSQIICLVGPPGVGKTSIAKSIAECLDRKYSRMSLGGISDESEIRGHRRTYIGAMPGKIINAINTAKTSNPVVLLDEIDKISSDFRGDPASALLEVLDPSQNTAFKDLYLDIPFDLSKVLFITTANSLSTIPAPLLDRMDVIDLSSYTRIEKFNIAKKHLIPKQLISNGLGGRVKFADTAIYLLIDNYTQEAGVRGLERVITEVLRKCAIQVVSDENLKAISISMKNVITLLGPARKKPGFSNKKNAVGIANGLAWTSVGGELLPIEVQVIEGGTGAIELTGSLGDVMKESAKLALTFTKVNAEKYGIDKTIFKTIDIHIHAPEGAIPKDGPSAGITLTTALISSLSGKAVRSDVAMTGEITLHGNVLPIGGLKEKTMAAYREKMSTVIIPTANVSDLYEVDELVKENIVFIPVDNLKEALEITLVK